MKIIIHPYKSQLKAPSNVIMAVREKLKVQVDGYKYTPQYERGWDGFKYFMDTRGRFLTGFTSVVLSILKSYDVDVINDTEPLRVDELDLGVGNGWTLTEDQERAVRSIISFEYKNGVASTHGVVDAAVNSGKTSIFASLIRNFPEKNFIILCNSTKLFRQTVRFFFEIYGEDGIGVIQGTTIRLRRITVAMVQSLYRRVNKEISDYFDVLIADESHNLSNKMGIKVLSNLNCPYRYFFSGTAYDKSKKIDRATLLGLCGTRIVKITNKHNQDKGVSLQADVYFHKIMYPVLSTYRDYEAYMMIHPDRCKTVYEIIKDRPNKKTLIVCKFIEHCENLMGYLEGIPNLYYTTGQDVDSNQIIDRYKNDPAGVLLTTYIIKEGINIPDIQVLISCFGGKDEISVKQIAGRVIRTDGVLTKVEIHDFYDQGTGIDVHSDKRIEYYKSEGYNVHPPKIYYG